MYIRDIMTTNVVTIPSSTSVAEAKRIMAAHRIERLPVADKGKLVGIVTARRLERVSPSQTSSLTAWELSYILEKTAVKELMEKHVLTVPSDMMVEEAVSVAQSNRVGCLVVLEESRVVGISTTTDLFYRILNPLLGVVKSGETLPGTRIQITGGGEGKALEEIVSTVNKLGMKIFTIHSIPPVEGVTTKDIWLHLEDEDVSQLVSELESKGYPVKFRKYS